MGMQPIALTTADSITLELTGAASSDQPEFIASYIDTADDTTTSTKGELNSTTPVTAVAAPGSGTRLVYRIDVTNIDDATVTVVMKAAGGTGRTIRRKTIYTGKCVDMMEPDPYPQLSNNLADLTDDEVAQLENIGAETISAAQWGYLGAMDQALATTDAVTFSSLTLSTDLAVAYGGTGASTASAAATNLGLGTGDSPTFAGLTVAADTDIYATIGRGVFGNPIVTSADLAGFAHVDQADSVYSFAVLQSSVGKTIVNAASGQAIDLRIANVNVAEINSTGFISGDLTRAGKGYVSIKGDDDGDDDPGCLVLYDHDGTPYYLWVDRTGDLRIHTAAPTDEDADGTIVGTQS